MMWLWFCQFRFLLRKHVLKMVLLLVVLWMFYSSRISMQQWGGYSINIVDSNEGAIYYWLICILIICAVSILLLYSIYRYKTRWMLMQGNKLAYVLANVIFLILIFLLWYIMFMLTFYSSSIQQLAMNQPPKHIENAIHLFYLYLPSEPLMGQVFPYTIENILRSFVFFVTISSCVEYTVTLLLKEKQKQKVLESIYIAIVFVSSWYILLNTGFVVQVSCYSVFIVLNIIGSKKTWKKENMGG